MYLEVAKREDFIISHQEEFSLILADENTWSSSCCLCSLPTTYHVDGDAQTSEWGMGFQESSAVSQVSMVANSFPQRS